MAISAFANALAAITLAGVTTKLPGIPKELKPSQLPSQWVDMPSAVINPENPFGTLAGSASRYSCVLYIAVDRLVEGLPDTQRTAMLQIADAVEIWAEASPYTVEIELTPRIPVGGVEHRGLTVRVTAEDME